MCGIAGVVRFDGRKIEKINLKSMTDTLSHRGPDGEGHWVNENASVGLGHRRLSIIDLSNNGHQPMTYGDGRYTITFNGEIYNYLEIKEFLKGKGYKFHSASDTEVLLALYDLKKEKCLFDLDGMFAFGIYDKVDNSLFCARDRFGEKPFYYEYRAGEYFAFGSEMKAIWKYTGNRETNNEMVLNYLNYGFVTNPQKPEDTFYKDTHQLPAASYCIIKNGSLAIQKYWELPFNNLSNLSFESAQGKFRELFNESVSRRLRSDVAVGSSLSGGLDSSLVVCVINELLSKENKHINTFSARFKDFIKDEGKYMQHVVDKTGAIPHYVFSDAELLNDRIDKIFYHQEEPFGSSSILVQYQVFELAKKNNVTVLLDGQGADEILAGYIPYYQTFFNELALTNPSKAKKQLDAYLDLHKDNKINIPSANLNSNYTSSFRSMLKRFSPSLVNALKPLFIRKYSDKTLNKEFSSTYNAGHVPPVFRYDNNSLSSHLHAHTTQYGLGTLLRYADRNSMAHSREVRLPFLSHKLVEFLFSLPSEYKIHNGWTKYLMRKSYEDILPQEITWRKDKIGYEPPQKEWMSRPDIIQRTIESREKLVNLNILDKKVLDKKPDSSGANEVGDKSWEHIMVSKLYS